MGEIPGRSAQSFVTLKFMSPLLWASEYLFSGADDDEHALQCIISVSHFTVHRIESLLLFVSSCIIFDPDINLVPNLWIWLKIGFPYP